MLRHRAVEDLCRHFVALVGTELGQVEEIRMGSTASMSDDVSSLLCLWPVVLKPLQFYRSRDLDGGEGVVMTSSDGLRSGCGRDDGRRQSGSFCDVQYDAAKIDRV